MTRWLSDCQDHHEHCDASREEKGWYPSRLLNVDTHQMESGSDLVRLIECAKSPPTDPSYLTLSHCWGSTTFLCLNRSTIRNLQAGFSVALLPETFRDAILIARRLRVQYLWIDSLCIMQDKDDLSDWLNEAGQMHKVYSNAILNISAAGAANSTKGLFAHRDPETLIPPEVQLFMDGLQPSKESTKYRLYRTAFWETELAQAPLIKRAWVLQERLLAPRVLHFGQNELLWECCEMEASEAYPNGLIPAMTIGTASHFKRLDPLVEGRRLRQYGLQEMDPRFFGHELWKRVVENYSACLLTNGEDKLIALSGIAKRISRMVGDRYVVGMWKFCLESQLLWWVQHRRQANDKPSVRPAEYRAPTFSWASVDGCVSHGDFTDKGILIEVVDVQIDYVTDDVTGPVKGGVLHLRGTLKKLKLERAMDTTTWITIVNGVEVRSGNSRPAIILDVDQADFEEQNQRERLHFIPIRAPVDRYQFFMGLILESVGEESATFRRLGVLMTSSQNLMQALLDSHDNEEYLPCKEYDEQSHRHTVHLI